mmetsp:Transcript_129739/g.236028  ORF Transcript_129739/g.236028 Transcript_129739/m.236028 type:complete len:438 (+) Transcript_129739:122-1435(+)
MPALARVVVLLPLLLCPWFEASTCLTRSETCQTHSKQDVEAMEDANSLMQRSLSKETMLIFKPDTDTPTISSLKLYVKAVYPALPDIYSDEDLLTFVNTLEWFYGRLIREMKISGFVNTPLVQPSSHVCPDGFFDGELMRRDLDARFGLRKPCSHSMAACMRSHNNFASYATTNAMAHATDLYIEVTHLSFKSLADGEPVPSADQFVDNPDISGWWFIHAPGSGIFYHAGRTCVATHKTSMLAKLLGEYISKPHASTLAHALPTAPLPLTDLLARVRLVADGSRTCEEVGIPSCRLPYVLADEWDPVLVGLGRRLTYTSLFFTASPRLLDGTAEGELVDLRIPASHLFDDMRSSRFMPKLQNFTTEQARTMMQEYTVTQRISLRDPFDPADSEKARACLFTNQSGEPWGRRLACSGHVSWHARFECMREERCSPISI